MKRQTTLRILALLLASLLLCLLLTGCVLILPHSNETQGLLPPHKETGEENMYGALVDHLTNTPAVTLRTEMAYEATLSGDLRYSATYSSTEVYEDIWGDSMFISYDATVTTTCKSGGIQVCSTSSDGEYREEYRNRKGFADGYMFREYTAEGLSVKNKSPISAESYSSLVDYSFEDNFISYLNYNECETADRRKLEDGSWELRFAGLCEEDLYDLDVLYGLDFSCVSDYVYVEDATITIIATSDFRFAGARIELEYAEYDEEGYFLRSYPTVTYDLTFEETSAITAADIHLEEFSDIGDLRMLRFYSTGLDNRGYADKGQYTYEEEEYWVTGGEESFCKQDQSILFDYTTGGKLIYEVTGNFESSLESWLLTESYQNGVLTYKDTNKMTGEVEESRYDVTPEDILWDISYFIWPADFSALNVERIECLDEKAGKYRLHLGMWQRKAYEEIYAAEGAVMTDFPAYVDFPFFNGALYEYTYHMEHAAKTAEGSVDTYRQALSWSFEKVQPVLP